MPILLAGVAAQPKGNVSAADGELLLLPLGGGEALPYAEALAACRTAVLDSLPGGPNEAAWATSTSPILLYLPGGVVGWVEHAVGVTGVVGPAPAARPPPPPKPPNTTHTQKNGTVELAHPSCPPLQV
jgi:hypothetical protein